MRQRHAYALRDLIATLACAGTAACIFVGLAPEPDGLPARTLENLRSISQAAQLYRQDNDNYLPMTLVYSPRGTIPRPGTSAAGWCTWSFGGKNNNSW